MVITDENVANVPSILPCMLATCAQWLPKRHPSARLWQDKVESCRERNYDGGDFFSDGDVVHHTF